MSIQGVSLRPLLSSCLALMLVSPQVTAAAPEAVPEPPEIPSALNDDEAIELERVVEPPETPASVVDGEPIEPERVPEPPEIPPPLVDGESIEPDVTIIKRKEGTISEYRINGQLYMVKVKPVVGPAYYLLDRDGDGEFDSRSNDPTNISVPQWILLRW